MISRNCFISTIENILEIERSICGMLEQIGVFECSINDNINYITQALADEFQDYIDEDTLTNIDMGAIFFTWIDCLRNHQTVKTLLTLDETQYAPKNAAEFYDMVVELKNRVWEVEKIDYVGAE